MNLSEIESALKVSFFGFALGPVLLLILGFLFGLVAKPILEKFVARIKTQIHQRVHGRPFIDNLLELNIENPLAWVLLASYWKFLFDSVDLPLALMKMFGLFVQILMAFHLIRLSYKAVDAFGKFLEGAVKRSNDTLDNQLAPFAAKTLKVFVILFGGLLALQSFGFNVVSLLAGLGIGGLALALAAQDTAANLFGSITIILDRPFKVGDYIKVLDVEGEVEEVGFRSTRVRTFYKSLVTVPNSTMAKEKIDNMGERPVRRLRHILSLEYSTPVPRIEEFIDRVRYYINQNPLVLREDTAVVLESLGDFDLKILVQFFAQVSTVQEERALNQNFLLECLKISQEIKVQFAFPTQTLHVASTPQE